MTPLALVLGALLTALCAVREPTADARTPAQIRQAARRAGWARCTGTTLLVVIVPALYVLAAACAMCLTAARVAGVVFLALGDKLAALGGPAGLEAA